MATHAITRVRYEHDAHAWAFEQAAAIRARRWADLDVDNLAEEIESLGRSEYNMLVAELTVVLHHLLKWRFQPERRGRSWSLTIAEHRDRIQRSLRDSPSLKARRADAVADAYRSARRLAAGETELRLSTFPSACPFAWEDIMTMPTGDED